VARPSALPEQVRDVMVHGETELGHQPLARLGARSHCEPPSRAGQVGEHEAGVVDALPVFRRRQRPQRCGDDGSVGSAVLEVELLEVLVGLRGGQDVAGVGLSEEERVVAGQQQVDPGQSVVGVAQRITARMGKPTFAVAIAQAQAPGSPTEQAAVRDEIVEMLAR
jgi:hypothetical protein